MIDIRKHTHVVVNRNGQPRVVSVERIERCLAVCEGASDEFFDIFTGCGGLSDVEAGSARDPLAAGIHTGRTFA